MSCSGKCRGSERSGWEEKEGARGVWRDGSEEGGGKEERARAFAEIAQRLVSVHVAEVAHTLSASPSRGLCDAPSAKEEEACTSRERPFRSRRAKFASGVFRPATCALTSAERRTGTRSERDRGSKFEFRSEKLNEAKDRSSRGGPTAAVGQSRLSQQGSLAGRMKRCNRQRR